MRNVLFLVFIFSSLISTRQQRKREEKYNKMTISFHCLHTSLSCTCKLCWSTTANIRRLTVSTTGRQTDTTSDRQYWLSKMMHFHATALFVLGFFIRSSLTQIPPVVPLTSKMKARLKIAAPTAVFVHLDALTAVYCHHSDEPGMMTIRCGPNEKIRMLDAFDATARNKSRLPVQCWTTKNASVRDREDINDTDCKVHTSFTSACSGRENCTLHMQRIRLNSARDHCQNELVDYTMAFFECVSGTAKKLPQQARERARHPERRIWMKTMD